MYGQIHMCVRSLVLEKFGKEKWDEILKKSGCNDVDQFMTFERYDDTITLGLVGAVTEVLGVSLQTVLEIFGDYFLKYCMNNGYDRMLRTLGEDFKTFITNLDGLHAFLKLSYKNIKAPSFRCMENEEGDIILHYYSVFQGFHHIVTGLCRAVARDLYDSTALIEILEVVNEEIGNQTMNHVTFKISFSDTDKKRKEVALEALIKNQSTSIMGHQLSDNSIISPKSFCEIFPFHILFDKDLYIRQCGSNVARWSPISLAMDLKLDQLFTLETPRMALTFSNVLMFCNASYLLEAKSGTATPHPNGGRDEVRLTLRGQMLFIKDINHILFIGSPRIESLSEMEERKLFLSDIPLYDVTRDLVLLNQQRIAELEVSKRLDETMAELKKTSVALEHEKAKTDMLLHQMLPVKVADSLREGKKVYPEKYESATILFSDIVTFTNIAAAVQPIDIVSLLNELYVRFDGLLSKHSVYKVETIGDAYMIVAGVPERTDDHAQCVADFSLDQVDQASKVMSPATGKPIQIRVGLHSGPVVAGVVGDQMPRYCLFGDTVNTASRMESHGMPGRIHLSPFTYSFLHDKNYKCEGRGEIEVKGKGRFHTYFLLEKLAKGKTAKNPELFLPARDSTDGKEKETTPPPPQTSSTPPGEKQNGSAMNDTKESKTCVIC